MERPEDTSRHVTSPDVHLAARDGVAPQEFTQLGKERMLNLMVRARVPSGNLT